MADPKPFASLSSGLLARKGAARPAMKPQGFGQMGGGNLEDLGWNDMGFEPPKPAEPPRDATHDAFGEDVVEHPRAHPTGLTPIQSPVHTQQAEIADRFGSEEPDEAEEFDETAEPYETEATPSFTAAEPDEDEEVDETAELYQPEPAFTAAAPEQEEEEEVDETAELYEPALEPAPQPQLEAQPESVTRVKPAVAAVTPNPAPRRAPKQRSAPGAKGKAAFTLRLDPSRHLKLRLACAVNGRSAQQLVTDALDELLELMPELDAMAQTAKRKD